jgi:hypothetical protein
MTIRGNSTLGFLYTAVRGFQAIADRIDLETSTGSSKVALIVGSDDPLGNVTGEPGDLYIREDGYDSAIYQYVDATSGDSSWALIGGSSQSLSEILTLSGDADRNGIENIGDSVDGTVFRADAFVAADIVTTAVVAPAGTTTLDYVSSEVGIHRTTWIVTTKDASGDSWAFDFLTIAHRKAGSMTLRVAKALITGADQTGEPSVTVAASIVGNDIRLTVTNGSAGNLAIRIAHSSVIEADL